MPRMCTAILKVKNVLKNQFNVSAIIFVIIFMIAYKKNNSK